ncbi:DUF1580 domain-containing protein [Stieleria varia]|uniref:DUF1580 domain-containing protein n=1 Tax=Stieleria varia TaxID=2528005 RepID=UPI0036F24971
MLLDNLYVLSLHRPSTASFLTLNKGDLRLDLLIRLRDVPAIIEELTGELPHLGTVYRWVNKGLKGVHLRTAFFMGCKRTRRTWVCEFIDALSCDSPRNYSTLVDDEIRRTNAAADDVLASFGIAT